MPLLSVTDLSIAFRRGRGRRAVDTPVVQDVSFDIEPGEVVALVGESGSGKTLTGKALMGLLPRTAHATGKAMFSPDGSSTGLALDLFKQSDRAMRALRGNKIAMIFQEPMSALSPLHTVGVQVAEVLRVHKQPPGANIRKQVLETFAEVGFPNPERAYSAYPFELSGGLRQRAVIAMAMVSNPALVIADEPTTALDVTTQATVLDLLNRLQDDHGTAVVMITHDLGIVANMADKVVVLKRGRVMESGSAAAVLSNPGHPYTRALIEAAPTVPQTIDIQQKPVGDAILSVRALSKTYPGRRRTFVGRDAPIRAVAEVDFDLARGSTVAVVGESGSGKSTVARLVLRAERPDPGATMSFCGKDGNTEDIAALAGDTLTRFRMRAQMVFQDPYAALSPRMSVQDILTEPLKIHKVGTPDDRRHRALTLMQRVGLSGNHLARFPYAFSGGQRQRIAIARSLALNPELLVCDEPTSALDVSVQREVLELLAELQHEFGLSYLFISHDLAVVARLADRVMVMRRGRVVEEGPSEAVFHDPRHPYTQALIAACPEPDMDHRLDLAAVARGAGEPDSWPKGFRYAGDEAPGLEEVSPGHKVRCFA